MRSLDNVQSLRFLAPELVLVAAILALVIWDLAAPPRRRTAGLYALGLSALGASAALAAGALAREAPAQTLFYGLLAADRFTHLFRVVIASATAVAMVLAIPLDARRRDTGELFTLLLVIALGADLMVQSRDLLLVYLSIELVSVTSFVLAGFSPGEKRSSEAALKYVIFGGVASGVMLYGMSFLYGLTGSLHLDACAARVAELSAREGRVPEVVFVAVACTLVGFGYKISAAPFHMWTPDVYEGAPTPVTALFSVAPKAAGFAVMVRFFAEALGADGDHLIGSAIKTPWPILAGGLAALTMTVGNLSALGQDNVKRMLAYSSVAHAGYMLLGFSVFSAAGAAAIAFYVVTYGFMNLGAFLVVIAVADDNGGDESIGAFRGLGRRAPALAAAMAVFLFSLAGLPPLAGFVGKFHLFAALLRGGGVLGWALSAVGLANSVIALFYYARVLRAMYLERGERESIARVRPIFGVTGLALAVPTVALGVYWGPVYDFVAGAIPLAR